MSTITKVIASEVAKKLTENKSKNIEKLNVNLKTEFQKIYLKRLPKEVYETFEKFPSYFNARSYVQLTGNGFDWQSLSFLKPLPYSERSFVPNEQEAEKLLKMKNEVDKAKNEKDKLVSEIETALIGLRTYKRVQENFPEAFELLPNKITIIIG